MNTQHNADDTTISEYINDSLITAKIKAKFEAENILNFFKIHVDTNNDGIVVLTGEIHDIQAQRRAKEIAENTEGVRKVFTSWEQEAALE
ncbi:MAG: BON domain-containing protein [Alphaproteobacteria bacterium]